MLRALLPLLALALTIAACGMKTVDAETLAEVEASAMEPILDEQQDLAFATDGLETLSERRSQLEGPLSDARNEARRAESEVSEARADKLSAVVAGDTLSIQALDATIAAREEVYGTKQARADQLAMEMALLEARIEAAEVLVDLEAAEVELARATAARISGAEVDVEPFRQQVEALREAYAEALEAVDDVMGGA